MKIVFIGTPEFAVPVLEALNSKYEVVLVISQPNRYSTKKLITKPGRRKDHKPTYQCCKFYYCRIWQA